MIKEKIQAIRSGELSPTENVEYFLQKIRELDSYLNAFIQVKPEEVLKEAKRVEKMMKRGFRGKLAGLAIAIKSNINVKGYKITCGSKTLEDYVSPYDAEVIRRIRKEGGIIIGMTNMDEFACGSSGETSYFGPTRNPRAPEYIPGGSSSGSAAAVAAGMCDLALGSDTGGSIRNPASHTGIVGVKPSYGLVPRDGLIDLAMSLDQIGPLSPDVLGAALLLEVIAGYNPRECTTVKREIPPYSRLIEGGMDGMRIGISPQFEEVTNEEIRRIINSAVRKIERKFDVEIVEINLPYINKALSAYYLINYVEFFSGTRKFDGRRYGYRIEEVCGKEVLRRILAGSYISQKEVIGKYYGKALKVKTILAQQFREAFKKCDVIVGAAVPRLPHKLGEELSPLEMYSYDILTVPASLAGICAGVVPCGYINNIPVGLQFQADKFKEVYLLRAMRSWEKIWMC